MAGEERRCQALPVPSPPVTASVVLDDGGLSGRGRITVLTLAWHEQDPLAVEIVLAAQPDHPSLPRGRWVVLRDFLRYGLDEPTGDGEVRIRPDAAGERVWLELARPGRSACDSLPQDTARDFLARTEQCVPCGEERSDAAIEALLARLLES